MSAHQYLEALAATVARLEARGIEILEARFEQPHFWTLAVRKERAKLEVSHQPHDRSFSISRFRKSAAKVEYWDKPEIVPIAQESDIAELLLRAKHEIVARLEKT
jgi:hypothetical protein